MPANIASASSARPKRGDQPQSRRATKSSTLIGQESAIAWRKSGSKSQREARHARHRGGDLAGRETDAGQVVAGAHRRPARPQSAPAWRGWRRACTSSAAPVGPQEAGVAAVPARPGRSRPHSRWCHRRAASSSDQAGIAQAAHIDPVPAWYQAHQPSPASLLMPYTVLGSITVFCGVSRAAWRGRRRRWSSARKAFPPGTRPRGRAPASALPG